MSNILEKRKELEKLKRQVIDISLEIECAEKCCQHNWTVDSYNENYYTGNMELGTILILSDGTSITEKNRREIAVRKVWTRTCTKCGKYEETIKKYPTTFAPAW